MRTKNTPLKDYVLLRDKRRNIVKKKGVVLTRVHLLYTCTLIYRISFLFYIVHGISETGIFLICSLIPL